ncbi:MAG: uncharacterized protein KVP18_000852 [Porospora cf. gigantea A]|uniref:uncharacterized protein n=1 Tax=Porospora cf. gigantea A TaxID=2853593 RepID=UPI00355AB1CA|nr:MAG: hypothetical protein KVP18_000852 [Porospora cf. gigantea A]
METYGSLDLPPSCNSENAVAFSLLDCEQRMPPWLFAAFVEEHTHFTDLCNIWLTEIHHQEQQQRLDLIKGHSTAVLNSLALQAESVMQVLETQTAAQATLETTLVSVTSLICKALLPYETLRAQLLSIIEVLASFSRSTKLVWTRTRTFLFHAVSVGVLFLGLRLGKLRHVVLKGLVAQSAVLAVDVFLSCSNTPLLEMAFEGVKISVLLSVADLFDNVMMPSPDSSLHHSLSDAAGTINVRHQASIHPASALGSRLAFECDITGVFFEEGGAYQLSV